MNQFSWGNHQIPDEISLMVFTWAIATEKNPQKWGERLFKLSLVCQKWKAIILDPIPNEVQTRLLCFYWKFPMIAQDPVPHTSPSYAQHLFEKIVASQKRRWPFSEASFTEKKLLEREELISDWNAVQFERSLRKWKRSQVEGGTKEEETQKNAALFRKVVSRLNLDGYRELQAMGKKMTELPPETALFLNVSSINVERNEIEFVPDVIGTMPKLETIDLNNNNLTRVPLSLFVKSPLRYHVFLNRNDIHEVPEDWSVEDISRHIYPQKSGPYHPSNCN